jgi:hypothetical protein
MGTQVEREFCSLAPVPQTVPTASGRRRSRPAQGTKPTTVTTRFARGVLAGDMSGRIKFILVAANDRSTNNASSRLASAR